MRGGGTGHGASEIERALVLHQMVAQCRAVLESSPAVPMLANILLHWLHRLLRGNGIDLRVDRFSVCLGLGDGTRVHRVVLPAVENEGVFVAESLSATLDLAFIRHTIYS